MEKVLKYALPTLFILALITFSSWGDKQADKERQDVQLHGVRARAIVINAHFIKGEILMDIKFIHRGKRYYFADARTSEFEVVPGDSVSFLFLPDKPNTRVLLEDRFYTIPRKSNFGWLDGHQK